MRTRILNHEFELHFRARWPWSHMKLHRHGLWNHFIWGKISFVYGQPHLVPVTVCEYCEEAIQVKSAGDESWDWCEGCQMVEGPTKEITEEEFEAVHG